MQHAESSSSVKVGIRVRPEMPFSTMKGFILREGEGTMDITVNSQSNPFKFDHVIGPSVSQESVFNTCAAGICDKVVDGFNGCVFAYGQTGAGKTYTMTGPANGDAYVDRGICMRTASYLFAQANRAPPTDSITIRLSVLEIYNESLTDLLREAPPPMAIAATLPPAPKLIIVDTPTGVVVPSLYVLPLSSEEDAFTLLMEADSNRVVAEHQLNRSSSRSHVVYTFYLTRTRARVDGKGRELLSDPEVIQSKLHLIDLAGSERSVKTQSTGVVQKEAKYINKSLSFLEQVVLALTQSKRGHVPYRQSKLTYMLKDSLGGNCHTYMIACVWPHVNHVWETFSTLRFSARMKCIENAPVRNNLFSKEPSSQRMLQQVTALKRELALRDRISGRDAWTPDLTPTQRVHTVRLAGALLALPADSEQQLYSIPESELDIKSISQVSCLVGCLRAAVWEACDRDSQKVVQCIEKMLKSFTVAESARGDKQMYVGVHRDGGQDGNRGDLNGTAASPTTHASGQGGGVPDTSPTQGSGAAGSTDAPTNPADDGEDADADEQDHGMPNPHSSRLGLSFEDFKAGQGKQLHDAYEDVKATLREERSRQKSIISLVNQQKGAIDGTLSLLKDLDNHNDASLSLDEKEVQRARLQGQLDEAKLTYRAGYMELQLCKRQLAEATALKKRALSGLVGAFDRLSAANRVPLP